MEDKETGCCGPECNCGKPASGNKARVITGLIIMFVAVSVFAYKIIKANKLGS